MIEPAELFRVYSRNIAQPPDDARYDASRTPHEEALATPLPELEIMRVKLAMTEAMLAREQETVADLRKRLDAATDKMLALAQPQQPPDDVRHDAPRNASQPHSRRRWWPF